MSIVTIFLVAAALVAVAVAIIAARSAPQRPDPEALRLALVNSYEPAPPPANPQPLRWPDGLIAIDFDGVALHLGAGELDFRQVPWEQIRRVGAAESGGLEILVAGVGSVFAPSVVGARVFEVRGQRAEH